VHHGLVAAEQGEQEERGPGRDGADAPDDAAGPAAASGAAGPTDTGTGAAPVPRWSVGVDDRRGGPATTVRLRRVVGRIITLLAVAVRLIGWVLAGILVVRIGLVFVPVNPGNVIVEWIVRFADIIVWGFRDLFLPTDPRIGLVANYGLAAVFWLIVGLIAAQVLSALGQRVAGRSRS
jgi:hypothetical protein